MTSKKLKVGLTYDVRDDYLKEGYAPEEIAEFDFPGTIDALEQVIRDIGHQPERIGNIKALLIRLTSGERWDLVFNIAEGLYGFGREAQVPAILDVYNIPYTFSDPLSLSLTLHKGMTKHVVRDLGIPTPDFRVVESTKDLSKVKMPYPMFAKPVAEGTGKGINPASKITSRRELDKTCMDLLKIFKQPVLLETYLPGREFTVGILGSGSNARALGALEILLNPNAEQHAYSYENKERCEELVQYRLGTDEEAKLAMETALEAWRGLNLKDAGRVDLRSDAAGIPNFMEVNPLAGLHPKHSDLPILCTHLGISYRELINSIIESALERV
jgi:D-alanine-D-alanine ligase